MASLPPVRTIARRLAVAAAVGLLVVLAWYLPRPGFRWTRLVLFGLIAAAAVAGAVGVVRHRPVVAAAGGLCLVALGAWQAAIGVFVLPVALALLLAGTLDVEAQS